MSWNWNVKCNNVACEWDFSKELPARSNSENSLEKRLEKLQMQSTSSWHSSFSSLHRKTVETNQMIATIQWVFIKEKLLNSDKNIRICGIIT